MAFVDRLIQDLRFGVRVLGRSPLFTVVAVASLAIGLASAVALFTFLNALLFRPLPGRHTGDVHTIQTANSRGNFGGASSYADFQSFVAAAGDLLASTCATTNVRGNLAIDGRQQTELGAFVSGGCFELSHLAPHVGRLLTRSDEASASSPPIVISHSLWSSRFGADPSAVGRQVLLNGASATIVGVAPRGFAGLSLDSGAAFWASPSLASVLLPPGALTGRGMRMFRVYVRLRDGVGRAQLAATLATVAEHLRGEDPRAWTDNSGATRAVSVELETTVRFGSSPGAAAAIGASALGAIAGIVLLACVNLATMMVARGAARTRELNVRLALGASRGRVLLQLATESLLLAAAGVTVAVLLVAVALRFFDAYKPTEVPAFNLAIDWRVGAFATFIAFAASLLFGLAPAVHAVRLALAEGLRGRPSMIRRGWLRVGSREALIVVQVAASFALLVAAALFARALTAAADVPFGFSTARVAVVPVDLESAARTPDDFRRQAARLLTAADAAPGVEAATLASIVPMTGSATHFGVRADRPEASTIQVDGNVVAPGYFGLTAMRLGSGREFDARDHERAPRVAIVNETLARTLWTDGAAVGRTIVMYDDEQVEVVGVVADVKYRSLTEAFRPLVYVPFAQRPHGRFVIHARVADEGEAIVALDRAVRAVDARVMIGTVMPMRRLLDEAKVAERIAQSVGAAAGALQLGLALMAIWGLVAYAVERRTSEIGIRVALGATRGSILQLIMRPTAVLIAVGLVLGCAGGIAAATILQSEFIGLAPIDLWASIPVAMAFAAVTAAAAWVPARRATAIEPVAALRYE